MSYEMNLKRFDKQLLAEIAAEYQTLIAGRETMDMKDFLDVRNYTKARTDINKPVDELTEEQQIWREFYFYTDDIIAQNLDEDEKVNLDSLEKTMDELDELNHIIRQLYSLGREIEKLLIKQRMYIIVHSDKQEPNEYQSRKQTLENILFHDDTPISDRLQAAEALIQLADIYKKSLIQELQKLNNDIQKRIAEFEINIKKVSKQSEHEIEILRLDFLEWIKLAKEQHLSRVMATNSIINQVELDKLIPQSVIDNQGDIKKNLGEKETEEFKKQMVNYATLWEQSNQNEEKISQKKNPITNRVLGSDIEDELAAEYAPTEQHHDTASTNLNTLESHSWYRFSKVVYIILWVVGILFLLLFALADEDLGIFLGGLLVLWIILSLIKKAFLYIIRGGNK